MASPEHRFRLDHPDETWRTIRGRVLLPEGARPAPYVLVLHGFKGFMDWGFFPALGQRLRSAGFAAVLFNTSGSGIGEDLETFSEEESFRRDTLSRQLEDVERVRAWLESRPELPLDTRRRGLFGHSRGGGVALVHAAQAGDYGAVATWAAVDTFDRWDEETKRRWRVEGRLLVHNARTGQDLPLGLEALHDYEEAAEAFDVLAACARLRSPVLALHGEQDEAVDVVALERIAEALLPGLGRARKLPGGHTFGAQHPLQDVPPALDEALAETVSFFRRHLG